MKPPAALIYRAITAAALGAAAAGAVLPLLPTAPFLLVAAWSASRHAPELEAKLLAHPRMGPHLHAWRRERALSRPAKTGALVTLVASLTLTLLVVEPLWPRIVAGVVVAVVTLFLLTRPEPSLVVPVSGRARDFPRCG